MAWELEGTYFETCSCEVDRRLGVFLDAATDEQAAKPGEEGLRHSAAFSSWRFAWAA
jgi:hypothetical protein